MDVLWDVCVCSLKVLCGEKNIFVIPAWFGEGDNLNRLRSIDKLFTHIQRTEYFQKKLCTEVLEINPPLAVRKMLVYGTGSHSFPDQRR